MIGNITLKSKFDYSTLTWIVSPRLSLDRSNVFHGFYEDYLKIRYSFQYWEIASRLGCRKPQVVQVSGF